MVKSLNYDFKYPMPSKSMSNMNSNPNFKTSESTFNQNTNGNFNANANNFDNNVNSNYNRASLSSIYWMLQDPIDESKYLFNKSINEIVTNRQLDMYNRASINLLLVLNFLNLQTVTGQRDLYIQLWQRFCNQN